MARQLASGSFGSTELRAWCDAHAAVPENDKQVFVLHYEVDDTDTKKDPLYIVLLSNKFNLNKLRLVRSLQADATHKMIRDQKKVLVAGSSDANKKFHGIVVGAASNENEWAYVRLFQAFLKWMPNWSPEAVMADGASYITKAVKTVFPTAQRLMCFFHVTTNLRFRIFKGRTRCCWKKINQLVDDIQLAQSKDEFAVLTPLFRGKVEELQIKFPELDIDYIMSWFSGTLSLWFENGTSHSYCMTNNGLEATNGVISKEHTENQVHSLDDWLAIGIDIVKDWTDNLPPFAEKPSPPSDAQLMEAYQVFRTFEDNLEEVDGDANKQEDEKKKKNENNEEKFLLIRANMNINEPLLAEERASGKWTKFEHFQCCIENVWLLTVTPSTVRCTCREGSKKKLCVHSIANNINLAGA